MNDPANGTEPTTNGPAARTEASPANGPVVHLGRELQQIGEYQLIRRIGGGGMGVVYEALHNRLKRRVAIKLIAESHLADPEASRRFFREMEAAGRMEHPHIVQATDAGVAEGIPFLVMELVPGADLARLVRQYGGLPPLAALEAIDQVAQALDHIHAHGMVHRDIKPSNLLLSEKGIIKVTDLGLAHLLHPASGGDEVTLTGDVIGTVDYMAPEQGQNAKQADHRADIYSLGCCLYFLLSGAPVYGSGSRVDRLIAHRTGSVPDLAAACEVPLPRSVMQLFQEMLAKEPEQRPQSMRNVLTRLRKCREDLRAGFARSASRASHSIGGKSLPADAGLVATALNLFSADLPEAIDQAQQATILIDRPPRRRSRRIIALSGAGAVLALLAALIILNKSFWPPATVATAPAPEAPGTDTDGATTPETATPPHSIVLNAHPGGAVFHVHFSEDGRQVVSCGSDGQVLVWDVASKQRLVRMQHDHGPGGQEVLDVALIPGTAFAVSVCYSGISVVWDLQDGRKLRQFEQHRNQVEGIAWIADTRVLTTGRDDDLYIWDARTGALQARLANSHQGGVRAVAVRADGLRAVTGDYAGNVLLWIVEQGSERFPETLEPTNEASSIWCVDWIGDTDRVALGGAYLTGEPLLLVYDTVTHEVVCRYTHLNGRVYGVCASRDEQRLYSAADDVQGWSLESDTELPLFDFSDHHDNAFSVAESPDGELLATGGTDGTVRLFRWRELTGRPGAQPLVTSQK